MQAVGPAALGAELLPADESADGAVLGADWVEGCAAEGATEPPQPATATMSNPSAATLTR
jgi:hypothetical protein